VYAEDATKGVEPIPVEHSSVNDPEVIVGEGAEAPGLASSEEGPSSEATPADSKNVIEDSDSPGTASTTDAPGATDEAASQPAAPADLKKTPAAPQPPAP
jgi:hypothetical protein